MHTSLFLILLSISASVFVNGDFVPVLSSIKTNQIENSFTVGEAVELSAFRNDLNDLVKGGKVDVIVVDELSDADIHNFITDDLKDNVRYQPLVVNPIEAIKDLENNKNVNIVSKDGVQSAIEAFKESQLKGNNVILTGRNQKIHSSSLKVKRDVPNLSDSENGTYYVFDNNCSAVFDKIYFSDLTAQNTENSDLVIDESDEGYELECNNGSARLKVKFVGQSKPASFNITELTLTFESNSQYWVLKNSTVNTTVGEQILTYMGTPYQMETPLDFSFVCTRTYFKAVSTDNKVKFAFYIERLQIQPANMNVQNGTQYIFGKVNYCQGFFSSGIWMAITSSLILVFILACGVSFLFNINTMDRFDDPKGKPLQIVQEK